MYNDSKHKSVSISKMLCVPWNTRVVYGQACSFGPALSIILLDVCDSLTATALLFITRGATELDQLQLQ